MTFRAQGMNSVSTPQGCYSSPNCESGCSGPAPNWIKRALSFLEVQLNFAYEESPNPNIEKDIALKESEGKSFISKNYQKRYIDVGGTPSPNW